MQNNHWDNALRGLTPLFVSNGTLDYNYYDKTLFNGLNEYRFFDIRNLRQFSQNVRSKFVDSMYHVILNTDESRGSLQYFQYVDYDGKRVISNKEGTNTELDGDYAMVNFYLSATSALPEGTEVYVYGEFTDWKLKPEFKMDYNASRLRYNVEIPLKQGRFEYSYAVVNADTKMPDESVIEGNHSQTENEYMILVYTRNFQYGYDELIGANKIVSNAP
jgi:hypothetical protein